MLLNNSHAQLLYSLTVTALFPGQDEDQSGTSQEVAMQVESTTWPFTSTWIGSKRLFELRKDARFLIGE
jgi:hypothetical protein